MENIQSFPHNVLTESSRTSFPPAVAGATPLQRDVLRVLAYFDVFQHPLTAHEIYLFLPSNSTTPTAVELACHSAPLKDLVVHYAGYYHVAGRDSGIIHERAVKEARANKHWRIAVLMASVVRHFPFVRGVFISGELAKGVASEDGDVDLVIVAEHERLWICRTLLIAFKKIFLLNKKKYFCLNHLMTTRNLTVHDRSLYTAIEIATLKPILNIHLFEAYQRANDWIRQFLPNYTTQNTTAHHSSGSLLQRTLERLFFPRLAELLDLRLMELWRTIWKRRYANLTDEKRNVIFHCSRDLSTAYTGDFASKILSLYDTRLAQFGLHD